MKALRHRFFSLVPKIMLPKMLNIGSIEVQSLRKGYLIIYPQTIVYQVGWWYTKGTRDGAQEVHKWYT